uniref:Cytochrome-b5 reductase n=1 Tax=Panagrolaimus sp. ES5 TaxID=591445 RepID=A0AC34F6I1_9BILA
LTTAKTEYGRNKVLLRPGKGLMDWIRISTNTSLASQKLPAVTAEELIKHNKQNDCWILLFGNVYDVTKYLEYHPGGIPELMRAAGTDASDLFNQYHAWVNYQNMLKACIVGPFRGSTSKLPRAKDAILDEPSSKSTVPTANVLSMDSFALCASKPNSKTVRIRSNVGKLFVENLIVDATSKLLRFVIRRYDSEAICLVWDNFDWSNRRFSVKQCSASIIEIHFESEKALEGISITDPLVSKIENQKYHSFEIQAISHLTHNAYVYTLKAPEGLHMPIPIGHHCLMRLPSGLNYRPFTPISYENSVCEKLCPAEYKFFIKLYSEGKFTKDLSTALERDTIELSEPIGRKNIKRLIEISSNILLLAAGTGITPMINIMEHGRKLRKSTKLLWFNRSKKDIAEGLFAEAKTDESWNFEFEHILSNFEEDWEGKRGRVKRELLEKFLVKQPLIFICGPIGFNENVISILNEVGIDSNDVIVFQ